MVFNNQFSARMTQNAITWILYSNLYKITKGLCPVTGIIKLQFKIYM